jgi:hypothetical protein
MRVRDRGAEASVKRRGWDRLVVPCVALALGGVSGCGGHAGAHLEAPRALTAEQIDADPLALLPGSAGVVATSDAHAVSASGAVGAQLEALAERYIPIGDEAGFKASRDVDRVVAGAYSSAGVDVAAVLSGRFEEAKIKQAAEAHTQTRGGLLSETTYAGRTLFTVGDIGFAILTPRTALVGTGAGIRRALDRIRDGHPKREIPAWIQETIDTPNATATVCADFTQPVAAAAITSFSVSWVKGVDRVRVVVGLEPPGMRVTGRITYDDGPSATAGADGLQHAATMANLVALTGLTPRIGDLAIRAVDTTVDASFTLDDGALRNLLALATRYARN